MKRPPKQSRTINLRLLVISLVILAFLGPSIWGWHAVSVGRTAKSLLDRAAVYEETGETKLAAPLLQRYLMVNPDDLDTRLRVAQLHSNSAETPEEHGQAANSMYRVVGYFPERLDLRKKLAIHLIESRNLIGAEREGRALIARSAGGDSTSTKPEYYASVDPEVVEVVGRALCARLLTAELRSSISLPLPKGDDPMKVDEPVLFHDIMKQLYAMQEAAPGNIEFAAQLAILFRENSDTGDLLEFTRREVGATPVEHADKIVDRMVEENIGKSSAYLLRYSYRLRFNLLPDSAAEDVVQAVRVEPDHIVARLTAARELIRSAANVEEIAAEAEEHLQHVIRIAPEDLRGYTNIASLMARLERFPEALGYLKKAREVAQSGPFVDISIQQGMADVHLRLGDPAKASDVLKQMKMEMRKAIPLLTQPGRISLDHDIRLLSGRLAIERQAWREAVTQLSPIVAAGQRDAAWATAARLLANANSQLRRWDQAALLWEELGRDDAESLSMAGQTWLSAGLPHDALKAFESYRLRTKNDVTLDLLASHLLIQAREVGNRDWSEFERLLETAKTKYPESQECLFAEVDYHRVEGRFGEATTLLHEAETKFKEDTEFWRRSAAQYLALNLNDQAQRALAEFRQHGGTETAFIMIQARAMVQSGQTEQASEMIEAALDSLPMQDRRRLHATRLQLLYASGQSEKAKQLVEEELFSSLAVEEGAGAHSEDKLNLIEIAIALAFSTGDLVFVEQLEEKVAELGQSADFQLRYLRCRRKLMAIELSRGEPDQQLGTEIFGLRAQRPRYYPIVALAARYSQISGDRQQAIWDYQGAIELGDRRAETLERLATSLLADSQLEEAKLVLDRLRRSGRFATRSTELELDLAVKSDRIEDAIKSAMTLAQQDPDNPLRRITLANLLFSQGSTDQAIRVLSDATAESTADERTWLSMFTILLSSGREQDARDLIVKLDESNLGLADKSAVGAAFFELLGDVDEALRRYEVAVRADPDNTSFALRWAKLLSRRDLGRTIQVLEEALTRSGDDAAIRRQLAVSYAASGRAEDWTRVDELLSGEEGQSVVLDRRLEALLLARKGRSRRERLENLRRSRELLVSQLSGASADDDSSYLLMAAISEQLAQFEEGEAALQARQTARSSLQELTGRTQPAPDVVARHARFLLINESRLGSELTSIYDEVERLIQKLEAAHQGSGSEVPTLTVLTLRAQLMLRRAKLIGQSADAEVISLVEDFAARVASQGTDSIAADPHQNPQIVLAIAQLYMSLSMSQAAEEWLRQLYGLQPARYGVLAGYLAANGRGAEAIELCLSQTQIPKALAARTLITVMLASGVTRDSRATGLVNSAIAENPNDLDLLLRQATLQARNGATREAIHLLEQVVSQAPRNVLALNNLATLLGESKREQEALQLIDKGLQIAGRQPALLDTKGTILLHAGSTADAVRVLEEATGGIVQDPRSYFHLAAAYQKNDDLDAAREAMRLAEKSGFGNQLLTPSDKDLLKRLQSAALAMTGYQ